MSLMDVWDDYTARTVWRFGGFESAYGSFPGRVVSFFASIENAIDELGSAFVFAVSVLLCAEAVEYRAPEIPPTVRAPKPVRCYVIRPKALHGVIASLAPPVIGQGQRQELTP